jgi:hypothetical protein
MCKMRALGRLAKAGSARPKSKELAFCLLLLGQQQRPVLRTTIREQPACSYITKNKPRFHVRSTGNLAIPNLAHTTNTNTPTPTRAHHRKITREHFFHHPEFEVRLRDLAVYQFSAKRLSVSKMPRSYFPAGGEIRSTYDESGCVTWLFDAHAPKLTLTLVFTSDRKHETAILETGARSEYFGPFPHFCFKLTMRRDLL